MEKSKIGKLVKKYQASARWIDRQAQDAFDRENKRFAGVRRWHSKENGPLELQSKELYEAMVGPLDIEASKLMDALNGELAHSGKKEQGAIQRLDEELKMKLDEVKKSIRRHEKEISEKIDAAGNAKLQSIGIRKMAVEAEEEKKLLEGFEKYLSSFSNDCLSRYKISDERHSIFTDRHAEHDVLANNLSGM
jgi:hypothetical protein